MTWRGQQHQKVTTFSRKRGMPRHPILVGRQKQVQGKPRKSLSWGLRGKGKARSATQDQLVGVILGGFGL